MEKRQGAIAIPVLIAAIVIAALLAGGSWWYAEQRAEEEATSTNTAAVVNANVATNVNAAGNANTSSSDGAPLQLLRTLTFPEYQYAYNLVVANGYLYVARGSEGLSIYSIVNPGDPQLVGTYDPYPNDSSTRYYDVAVQGTIAALTSSEMSVGPLLIDIADPKNPKKLSEYNQYPLTDGGSVLHSIALVGNYAYYTQEGLGMKILDISDPQKPVFVGQYKTLGKPTDIVVAGNTAYIADSRLYKQPGQMVIVDVTNPTKPVALSSTVTGGKAESLATHGGFAYVANSTDGGVKVYDVVKPKLPVAVGAAKDITAEEVYVEGTTLFVGTRAGRLAAYDLSQPSSPQLVAYSDQSASSREIAAAGDYVYVVSSQGIEVFKLNRDQLLKNLDTNTNTSVSTAGWKTYTNSEFDFTLRYPGEYELEKLSPKGFGSWLKIVGVKPATEENYLGGRYEFNIKSITPTTGKSVNDTSYDKEFTDWVRSDFAGTAVVGYNDKQVKKVGANTFTVFTVASGMDEVYEYFIKRGDTYLDFYSSNLAMDGGMGEKILSTLSFQDETADWDSYRLDEQKSQFYQVDDDGKQSAIPMPFDLSKYHGKVTFYGTLFWRKGDQRTTTFASFGDQKMPYENGVEPDFYWYDHVHKVIFKLPALPTWKTGDATFDRVFAVHASSSEPRIMIEVGEYNIKHSNFEPGLLESQPVKTRGLQFNASSREFIPGDPLSTYLSVLGIESTQWNGFLWDSKNAVAVATPYGEGCGQNPWLTFVDLQTRTKVRVGSPEGKWSGGYDYTQTSCNPQNGYTKDEKWVYLYGTTTSGKTTFRLYSPATMSKILRTVTVEKLTEDDFSSINWDTTGQYPKQTTRKGVVIDFNT